MRLDRWTRDEEFAFDSDRALADLGLAPEGDATDGGWDQHRRGIRSSGQFTTISRFAQG